LARSPKVWRADDNRVAVEKEEARQGVRGPAQSRTERQQNHGAVFAEAVKAWKRLSLKEQKRLDKEARQMIGFNLYVSRYIKRRSDNGEVEP
jgi:hypothetical protein